MQLSRDPCIRSTIKSRGFATTLCDHFHKAIHLAATCDPLANATVVTPQSTLAEGAKVKSTLFVGVADSLHSTECSLRLTSCWSHVLLSLSCREPLSLSPVLPTRDREDPLANVNARITVFIAQPAVPVSPPPSSFSRSSLFHP